LCCGKQSISEQQLSINFDRWESLRLHAHAGQEFDLIIVAIILATNTQFILTF
jgi:hypothetical protein